MSKKVSVDIVETRVKTICVLVDEFNNKTDVKYMVQDMCYTGQIDMNDADYSDLYIDVDKADNDDEVDLDLTRFGEIEDDVKKGINVFVDADGVYHIKTSVVDLETTGINSNTEFDSDAVINAVIKAYYNDDEIKNIDSMDMIRLKILICKNIKINFKKCSRTKRRN